MAVRTASTKTVIDSLILTLVLNDWNETQEHGIDILRDNYSKRQYEEFEPIFYTRFKEIHKGHKEVYTHFFNKCKEVILTQQVL